MSDTLSCPSCGSENEAGRKFCGECGTALAAVCSSCGAANAPGVKFCGECGAALTPSATPSAPTAPLLRRPSAGSSPSSSPTSSASHRFSEGRDAEDVRELLSRYFDTARTRDRALRRYGREVHRRRRDGGLGNADRAGGRRRAGRARGARPASQPWRRSARRSARPSFGARAGVLTGEAAVTLGAEGQGMVAGDLVNTASRIQSRRRAGNGPRRRGDQARVGGRDRVRGRRQPHAQGQGRAGRALAGGPRRSASSAARPVRRGSSRRSSAATASSGSSRSSSTRRPRTGERSSSRSSASAASASRACRGSSRSTSTGSPDDVWWHSGRCLAYGDGVAFWALAEMVRGRAGIVEDEEPSGAARSCAPRVEEHIPDPRGAPLRRAAARPPPRTRGRRRRDQENLFAAARMFFERLAEQQPDGARLRGHPLGRQRAARLHRVPARLVARPPLFVLTLARPELPERRPTWGAGKRNFTSLFLEPLARRRDGRAAHRPRARACPTSCASGSSSGPRASRSTRSRPCGCCSTAASSSARATPTAPPGRSRRSRSRDPARADRRAARRARARGAARRPGRVRCSGKTFTLRGPRRRVRARPRRARADPRVRSSARSPARVQSDPLLAGARPVRVPPGPRQEGRLRHALEEGAQGPAPRRGARTCARSGDEDEIVEVLAAHYLDAYRAAPDDADAEEVRDEAREMLVRAGRARRLARRQRGGAARYEQATELADDPVVQAELHERAGAWRTSGARPEEAAAHYEAAIALFDEAGETHAASPRGGAPRARSCGIEVALEEGIERMDRAFRRCRRRSRTLTSPGSPRSSGGSSSSPAATTSRCSASSPRSTRRGALRSRRRSRRR